MIAQPARALCRQPALVFLPGRPDFCGGNRLSTERRGGTASAPIPLFRSGVGRALAAVSNSLHALLLLGPGAVKGPSLVDEARPTPPSFRPLRVGQRTAWARHFSFPVLLTLPSATLDFRANMLLVNGRAEGLSGPGDEPL